MSADTDGVVARPEAPVPAAERIAALDVLRGFALLGIFIMNMPGFTHSLFSPPPAEAATVDGIVAALRDLFFAGKFNLLFGLLFGIGFTLQLARFDGPGTPAAPSRATALSPPALRLLVRRLGVLLALGLVHAVLLWSGDVLVVYAVLGFALLACARLSDRALLALIALCLVLPAASETIRSALWSNAAETLAAFQYQDFVASNDRAFGRGSLFAAMAETARVFVWTYTSPLGLFSVATFYVQMATGILVGLLVGRRGWVGRLGDPGTNLRRAHRIALAIVIVGLASELVFGIVAADTGSPAAAFLASFARTVGRAALAAFYALAVVRLLALQRAVRWSMPFACAGRMPLSNYLLQTLLASFAFYGWGLGFWGRAGPAAETLLAVALFVLVQLPLSTWWLRRHAHGPLEYLWRLLTYGRRALKASPTQTTAST